MTPDQFKRATHWPMRRSSFGHSQTLYQNVFFVCCRWQFSTWSCVDYTEGMWLDGQVAVFKITSFFRKSDHLLEFMMILMILMIWCWCSPLMMCWSGQSQVSGFSEVSLRRHVIDYAVNLALKQQQVKLLSGGQAHWGSETIPGG